jgi:predicted RNase H-like HicB family nuclease
MVSCPQDQFNPARGAIRPSGTDIELCDQSRDNTGMERIIRLHIEKLPEGVYLGTSDDIPGLVAQGRTITETLEIARDVARKLIEEQGGNGDDIALPIAGDSIDYPLVVAAG